MNITSLPPPSDEAKAISEQMLAEIISQIKTQGPMRFTDYMQQALYAPTLGYYRSGLQKFGQNGDFTTAPELSPLFSKCVARQCQQIIDTINQADRLESSPDSNTINQADILEFGAGSGAMAADILAELDALGSLPRRYLILELSAELRQRQQQHLQQHTPELYSRVQWLTQLPETPIKGVILANEVVDAMPVHLFGWQQGKLYEYHVNYQQQEHALEWQLKPPSSTQLIQHIEQLDIDPIDGYQSEINMLLPPWIASLANTLEQGLALIIDYGFPRQEYYHPQRDQGTLMCHYQHRAHSNPLILPGIQDITAHVDFTTIAKAAKTQGLTVSGFTHQAGFLLNCGINTLLPLQLDDISHYTIAQEIKRLTLPTEMGELFKAIALTKEMQQPLLGFSGFDQLPRLL